MIQALIHRHFGVVYHPHYICTLLHNLDFSSQKARFVSDHLDEAKRLEWRHQMWPTILRRARQRKALLLFGDEASFAQWGSLSYTWAPRGHQPEVPTSGMRKAYNSILKFFSLAIRAVLIFQVLHSIRATDNHSVASGLIANDPLILLGFMSCKICQGKKT